MAMDKQLKSQPPKKKEAQTKTVDADANKLKEGQTDQDQQNSAILT